MMIDRVGGFRRFGLGATKKYGDFFLGPYRRDFDSRINTIEDLRGMFCVCMRQADRGLAVGKRTQRWSMVRRLE